MNIIKPAHQVKIFAALIIAWLIVYWQTLIDMVQVWNNSETYTHCFLIVPISLYLIYEKRKTLSFDVASSSYLAGLALLFAQLLWVVGHFAGVNIIEQIAAFISINALVLFILGFNNYYKILFPMWYLIFAVPMGEELVPSLQTVTADISVFLLNLVNVPIYREGLYLYIPNGTFVVAEACAGIQFLIASVALGTLFAYFNYHKWWKRGIFFAICIVVPILANGIRVFGIVYLGYVSDMTVAVGADHLVYGWFFFMFVIVLLIGIGQLWQDKEPLSNNSPLPINSHENGLGVGKSLLFTLLLIAPSIVVFNFESSRQTNQNILDVVQLNQYFVQKEELSWQPSFHQAHQTYSGSQYRDNVKIEVYVANYAYDADDSELIQSNNRTHNIESYTIVDKDKIEIDSVIYKRSQLVDVAGNTLTKISWYQINKYVETSPLKVKLRQLQDKFTGGVGAGRYISIAFDKDSLSGAQEKQLIAELAPKFIQ